MTDAWKFGADVNCIGTPVADPRRQQLEPEGAGLRDRQSARLLPGDEEHRAVRPGQQPLQRPLLCRRAPSPRPAGFNSNTSATRTFSSSMIHARSCRGCRSPSMAACAARSEGGWNGHTRQAGYPYDAPASSSRCRRRHAKRLRDGRRPRPRQRRVRRSPSPGPGSISAPMSAAPGRPSRTTASAAPMRAA